MILPTRELLSQLGRRRRRVLVENDINLSDDEWTQYRKRPVTIHAKQLRQRVEIETREGTIVGDPGDYLIVGVDDEIYPCGEAIFEQTYEQV